MVREDAGRPGQTYRFLDWSFQLDIFWWKIFKKNPNMKNESWFLRRVSSDTGIYRDYKAGIGSIY